MKKTNIIMKLDDSFKTIPVSLQLNKKRDSYNTTVKLNNAFLTHGAQNVPRGP